MRKIAYEYILYYFQIFFMGLFVLVLLAYYLDVAEKDFLDRNMYSVNVHGIQLSDGTLDEAVNFEIPELRTTGDFMIYKHLVEASEIIRGIYGTSDVFGYSDYIAEGRFFTSADYDEKSPTVVIGPNILAQTFAENGMRYYWYNQQQYEVIGVFKNTGSVMDDTIYLNLTNLLEKTENIAAIYYVDAKNNATVDTVISEIQANADYTTMLVEYESNISDFGLSKVSDTLIGAAVLSTLFNLLITTVFFITRKKYTVAIQRLCGMTKSDLLLSYGKNIFLVIILSFLSIVCVITFLSDYMGTYFALDKLNNTHYIITGIILLVLGFATTYYIVNLAKSVDISAALKGR